MTDTIFTTTTVVPAEDLWIHERIVRRFNYGAFSHIFNAREATAAALRAAMPKGIVYFCFERDYDVVIQWANKPWAYVVDGMGRISTVARA